LELAVNVRADLIVAGDADLLALNPFRDIPIVTPAIFVQGRGPVIHSPAPLTALSPVLLGCRGRTGRPEEKRPFASCAGRTPSSSSPKARLVCDSGFLFWKSGRPAAFARPGLACKR